MSRFLSLPVLFFFLLVEWYGLQAVRTAIQPDTSGGRRLTAVVYVVVTLLVWGLGIWAISTRRTAQPHYKVYFLGLLLGLIAAKLVIALPLLLEDVVRGGRFVARQFSGSSAGGEPISRSAFLSRAALLLGAVPLVALVWGIVRGGTDYQVKRRVLRFPNLPASFDGFKILQISDLHTGSFTSKEPLQRAVKIINDQQADLIFMTGDLVNNVATEVEEHIETLAGIRSKRPIYSILGNHDYGDYVQWESLEAKRANLERLMQNHAKIGWELLMDENRVVEHNGEKIAILGVQNWGTKFVQHGNLAKAHAGSGDAPFKILLTHDPTHWDAQVHEYQDIDLTLSGHTHGAQFGVNLPHLKWSPVQYVYKQWAGLYKRGKQHLYVNVGLGFLGYPGRVGFLPEITVLELRRA
ncbi:MULTISPECIES: metallophosphoesterase [Hymenobacter]|uniref:Metallophosphoesterase n=2 Tax=Hymenobacter TaxID=89966 RepID=A0ABS6WY53_9BACT|nr:MULTISPECIES: metallophosphoesterase [Hymenobacter]MBO3271524.1 metallophosphoesterase [Hymenobacter defluvii]MBW3127664.1 metallophosphoesterase [Hymenobacter profundi]